MPPDTLLALALRLGLCIGISIPLALLLRLSGLPGGRPSAAITGGLLAGILLGPGVLGATFPGLYQSAFVGAQHEYQALSRFDADHEAEIRALHEVGVSPEAVREINEQRAVERLALERAYRLARARHDQPFFVALVTIISAALAFGVWSGRASPGGAASIRWTFPAAVMSVLLAALSTAVLARWLLGMDLRPSLVFGSAVAGGSALAALPTRWIPLVGRGPEVRWFGLGALLSAAALAIAAAGPDLLPWIIGPGAGIAAGALARRFAPPSESARRLGRLLVLSVAIPTLAAGVGSWIDPGRLAHAWGPITLVAVAGLTTGGGHLIGCWMGLLTFAPVERHARSVPFWVEAHAAGFAPTQIAWAIVLVAAGIIRPDTPAGSAILAAIALNALIPEVLLGVHRRMARRMSPDHSGDNPNAESPN